MQREMIEREVAEFAGPGQALGAERLTDPGLGVIGAMEVKMNPPRAVVVIQVVIQVPRVGAEGEGAGGHVVER